MGANLLTRSLWYKSLLSTNHYYGACEDGYHLHSEYHCFEADQTCVCVSKSLTIFSAFLTFLVLAVVYCYRNAAFDCKKSC